MKKKLLVGLAAGLFFLVMVGFANATLIENGDFEDGFNEWNVIGNNTVIDGVANIGRPGPNEDSYIYQDFFIDPSVSAVKISFDYIWFGNDSTFMEDIFTATFSYFNSSSILNLVTLVNESNHDGSFTAITYFDDLYNIPSLSSDSPNARINFSLIESESDELQGTRIELDNVVVAPVPEPSTMILFGIGIAGLVGVRFRKKR